MSENPENTSPPPPPADPPPPPSATPPPPPSGGAGANSNKTLMLVLAYLGPFALIPLLVEKDDHEIQWHAKHGLVLTVTWIVASIVFSILSMIPGLGCIFSIVFLFFWLIPAVIHIVAIVKAVNGERFIVPGLSQYADRF